MLLENCCFPVFWWPWGVIVFTVLVEGNAKKVRRLDLQRGERCSAATAEAARPTDFLSFCGGSSERSRSCKENLSAPQAGLTAEAFRDLRPLPEGTVLNGCYRVKVSVWEFCHLIGCSDKFCLDRSGALLKLKAKRIRCLTKRGI